MLEGIWLYALKDAMHLRTEEVAASDELLIWKLFQIGPKCTMPGPPLARWTTMIS